MDDVEIRARLEAVLGGLGIRRSDWEYGALVEGRCCLVREPSHWSAGFVERGQFDVRFTETDVERAIWRFVEWIVPALLRGYETERATAEWLRRRGLKRP
jgi:hypothetical protein